MKLFKNLTVYRFGGPVAISMAALSNKLAACDFQPCGTTQQKSVGWTPPRGAHGAMVECIGGQWIAQLTTETKAVPSQVLARRVDEMATQVEIMTGRKPGKKERRGLKDEALIELLPHAFPRLSSSLVWIDPTRGLLIVDAPTTGRADDVASALVKTLDGAVAVQQLHTAQSPAACMAAWLVDGTPPPGFTIDRECELKSSDAMRSVVKYGRHRLDTEEVRQHIQTGKTPTATALTYRDRLSFVLRDTLQIKRVEFLDVVFENIKDVDAFDANVTIATGELALMIDELVDALGGEHEALA